MLVPRVLGQMNGFNRKGRDSDGMVYGKAGELPVDEAGGFRHSVDIAKEDVDKLAPFIETALQHEAVEMRIPPQKITTGLVCQDHSGPDRPFSCFFRTAWWMAKIIRLTSENSRRLCRK